MNLLNHIDIVILCGGLGTRFREVDAKTPKVLAPAAGRVFLDLVVDHFKDQGFERFVFLTGYRADEIENYIREAHTDIDPVFFREKVPLGTGGALKHARGKIESDPFIMLNGDSLCRIDAVKLVERHTAEECPAGIVVAPLTEGSEDFGGLDIDKNQRVVRFKEKKKANPGGLVNAGVYCFSRKVFDYMPEAENFSLEYDLFPDIMDKGVYAFVSDEPFYDIGTKTRYERFNKVMDGE